MDTCFVTAKLTAKKGMEAQLEAEVVKNIPNVRAEKGCIRYDFHKNRSEDGTFLFYEISGKPGSPRRPRQNPAHAGLQGAHQGAAGLSDRRNRLVAG